MEFEGHEIDDAAALRRHLERRIEHPELDDDAWSWLFRFISEHPEHHDWVEAALREMVQARRSDGALRPTGDIPELFLVIGNARFFGLRPLLEDELALELDDRPDGEVEWLLERMIELTDDVHAPLSSETLRRVAHHGRRPGCFGTALNLLCWADFDRAIDFVVAELPGAVAQDEALALGRVAEEMARALDHVHQLELATALRDAHPDLLDGLRAALEARVSKFGQGELETLLRAIERSA